MQPDTVNQRSTNFGSYYMSAFILKQLTGFGENIYSNICVCMSISHMLLSDDWLPYTGRGDDYRGTVDVTRENRPCRYWADSALKFCPNNMFNSL